MDDKLFDGLTDEQKAKLKACKSAEELRELLRSEKIALSDEMTAAISGGCDCARLCVADCW